MQLQRNKVQNLRLAAKQIDGVFVAPGETFSLWALVGRPTRRKGYLDGWSFRGRLGRELLADCASLPI